MVHQDNVAPRNANLLDGFTGWRRPEGRQAEREGKGILRCPFDLEDWGWQLLVGAGQLLFEERVLARLYAGQAHGVAMGRISVGGIARLGADDLFEDQDVAFLQAQPASRFLRSRCGRFSSRWLILLALRLRCGLLIGR